mgnify:CR=1 FL=1
MCVWTDFAPERSRCARSNSASAPSLIKRITGCWEAIHKGLEEIGLGYVIDKEIQGHLVVTVKAPDDDRFDFSNLHDYCYERGFTIYPGKMFGLATFRLCNLGWITEGLNLRFYFGGTSLLIIVGVAMDTISQVEAQLIMRHYEGFIR